MEELKNELKQAFNILNSISIRVDQAEKAAMAKTRLSRAFALVQKMEEEQKAGQSDGKTS